jgi:NitT/TauT family transport system permease protein
MQNTILRPIEQAASTQPAAKPRRRNRRMLLRRFAWVFTLAIVLGLWQAVTMFELVDRFLLPPPQAVAEKFYEVLIDGTLWGHARTTLHEVLFGLSMGLTVGVLLGYMIAKNHLLEDLLAPIIVAFQSTPVVAYAPLLVIWFGTGVESKIITCALIVFFPMMMNTIVGIRSVPEGLHDLMRVSQANRWQIFAKLELPAAMPVLITGIKTSATLAVIGAVVGEFIVANSGLGFWINLARQQYDTPLVYVAVIALALMASTLYAVVSLFERRLLAWQRRGE